jgi:RNA polymerase sigma factor (sigma-70 family)
MDQSQPERVAAAYDAHYDVLRFIAARKFRVPPADVRPLIHDVFVAYMRHVAAIRDDRGWLIAATKHACLKYWRDAKPGTALPEHGELLDTSALRDEVAVRLDLISVLRRLPKHCREVLWRRYVEGTEPGDIAVALAKKSSYGRQIVHRCLRAAREALVTIRRGRA